MRVFIAHSIADDPATLQRYKDQIVFRLHAHGTTGVEVVLGRDDYEARAKQLGGWNGWMQSVATGTVYGSRTPLFDAFVIPGAPGEVYVGRATATMIELALKAGKLCWALFPTGAMAPVRAVVRVDAKDQKRGWQVTHE